MSEALMRNDPAAPRLALRPKEAARALGISARLLWSMTNRGEIPCVRIGRCVTYPVAMLKNWLNEQANNSKEGICR